MRLDVLINDSAQVLFCDRRPFSLTSPSELNDTFYWWHLQHVKYTPYLNMCVLSDRPHVSVNSLLLIVVLTMKTTSTHRLQVLLNLSGTFTLLKHTSFCGFRNSWPLKHCLCLLMALAASYRLLVKNPATLFSWNHQAWTQTQLYSSATTQCVLCDISIYVWVHFWRYISSRVSIGSPGRGEWRLINGVKLKHYKMFLKTCVSLRNIWQTALQ